VRLRSLLPAAFVVYRLLSHVTQCFSFRHLPLFYTLVAPDISTIQSPVGSYVQGQKLFKTRILISAVTNRSTSTASVPSSSTMSGHDPTDIDITSLSVDDGVAKARSDDPRTHVQASSEYDCAHCGKLAQHRCTRCAEGVDEHGTASPTFYCGTECQTHRWKPTHQHQCRLTIDRMQLFRVSSLVQWAFYENSRALWYNGVAEVKKIEHTDDNADLMLKLYKKYDAPEFPVFPKNLFEKEGDEQAVLAASASAGTIVCELVSQLVKGVYCNLQPITLNFTDVASLQIENEG
jgi:hypothetical protein